MVSRSDIQPQTPVEPCSAGFLVLETLKKRADFQRTARGKRAHKDGFVLQATPTGRPTSRIGFTCSKKVGNAVARNRAKRRLREIARLMLPTHGKQGWDYVLIGRASVTASLPFDTLKQDFVAALEKVHQ